MQGSIAIIIVQQILPRSVNTHSSVPSWVPGTKTSQGMRPGVATTSNCGSHFKLKGYLQLYHKRSKVSSTQLDNTIFYAQLTSCADTIFMHN